MPLLNPVEIVKGGAAKLGDPVLLPLGGKGIRSITEWRGQFLLVAGAFDGGGRSDLYLWDGRTAAAELQQRLNYGRLNPESLAEIPAVAESDLLIVSDDGNVLVGKKPCKKLKDSHLKRFRAALVPSGSIGVAAR